MTPREPEKGLTAEEKDHLADILRRIRDTRFDGNATEMARALGIGQSQVSQILKGSRTDRSAGIPVLKRIRAYTGLTIDALIGLTAIEPLVEPAPPPAPGSFEEEAARLAQLVLDHAHRQPPTVLLLPPKKKGSDAPPRPRRR